MSQHSASIDPAEIIATKRRVTTHRQENILPREDGQKFTILKTAHSAFILESTIGTRPGILYWGKALEHTTPEEISLLSVRQWAHGGPAVDVSASLSNELGAGVPGPPGFIAHRNSSDWAAIFKVTEVIQENTNTARIICDDDNTKIRATYDLALDPASNVFTATTTIENLGTEIATIDWCSALCIPLDRRLTRLSAFTGRWAMEFQNQEIDAFRGSYVRENKSGRTSHDNFPGIIAKADFTSEKQGPAAGFHLGWSGNNRVRVDRHSDGRAFVQMGELFYPGEMEIPAGATYETPKLFASWSDQV